MSYRLAFIGVGNMATATLLGITSGSKRPLPWSDIILFDKFKDKLEPYRQNGAYLANSIPDAVENADIIFLCVKPQNFTEVLNEIKIVHDVNKKVFVTIAAGITMETVSCYTNNAPVIRVMPNTPMLIGKGVIALCRNSLVSDEIFDFVSDVYKASGHVITIDESEMNRIISVTGSSPAYVFLMIKAIYDGAVQQGLLDGNLTEGELISSICDVIIGSAELLKAGTKTPDEQISIVCSKGGTTERAISELNNYRFCEGIASAMQKCTERADELGNNK